MTSKEKIKRLKHLLDLTNPVFEKEIPIKFIMGIPIEELIEDLEILEILKVKLDSNTLYRVFPYEVARQIRLYLKKDKLVEEWLRK